MVSVLGCSARWRINLPLLPQVLEHMEYPFQALCLQCNVLTICALLSKYSLFLSLKISATFCDWLQSTKTLLLFDLSFGAQKSKILSWPLGSSWAQCCYGQALLLSDTNTEFANFCFQLSSEFLGKIPCCISKNGNVIF